MADDTRDAVTRWAALRVSLTERIWTKEEAAQIADVPPEWVARGALEFLSILDCINLAVQAGLRDIVTADEAFRAGQEACALILKTTPRDADGMINMRRMPWPYRQDLVVSYDAGDGAVMQTGDIADMKARIAGWDGPNEWTRPYVTIPVHPMLHAMLYRVALQQQPVAA